jgi:molecular chaperone GrpE
MTEETVTEKRHDGFFGSLTPGTCRTLGTAVVIANSLIFWISIADILIRQLNLQDLPAISLPILLLCITVTGIFAGINILLNPDWRFVLWFVIPCFLFSLMAVLFLAVGFPEVWSYPFISYIAALYLAGTALLVLNIFILMTGSEAPAPEKDPQGSGIPLPVHRKKISCLSREEYANPVMSLESGAAALIGRIGNLEAELERTQKKSASEHRKVLLGMLETVDALDSIIAVLQQRVADGETHLKKIVNNFRSVRLKIGQVLTGAGVHPMETPDDRANPGTHKILEARIRPDLEDYTILEEIQKGYMWNGQVLRESIVIVGMKK